jgi:hypothetical protein
MCFTGPPAGQSARQNTAQFKEELAAILAFVEQRSEGREVRGNATGVFRVSAFLCVNTRVLKNLVHRCKSSINASLQQLGYASVRAMEVGSVRSELMALFQCSTAARQWSLRLQPREEAPKPPSAIGPFDDSLPFLSDDIQGEFDELWA